MKDRPFWTKRVEEQWKVRSVVWLSGVRRVGKTCLSKQISGAEHLNCDLPSIQRRLADPEFFFAQQREGSVIILDEVHRIADPSLILKIAADEYPSLRILATGSSTLQATKKFRDALTDRKRSVHLPPVLWRECADAFGVVDLDRRLLHGGLPQLLLSSEPDPAFFEDWMDGFYARDIQELFGVRNRTGFLNLLKMVCLRNGGQLDVTDLAGQTGLSRPTVMSHLDALEIAHAIVRIPPFHAGGHREIIKQPRVYAFDTGLVAHVKGWQRIRGVDRGHLWENLVLDELRCLYPARAIHYWRDKSQREVDFVIEKADGRVDTVEAKINPNALNTVSLQAFRRLHPLGHNYVVCPLAVDPYAIREAGLTITVVGTRDLPLF